MPALKLLESAPQRDETVLAPAPAFDPLLASLVIVARHRGVHLAVDQLVRDSLLGPQEVSPERLVKICRGVGLRGAVVNLRFRDLRKLGLALPAIVLLRNGGAVVLRSVDTADGVTRVRIQDPNALDDTPMAVDEQRFCANWSGGVVLVKRDHRVAVAEEPFGFRMIFRELFRDPKLTRDIAIAAFVLGFLALAPYMFWRLLIDRVVYFQSLNTLGVISLAMVTLVGFETAFGYLRRYLTLYAARNVDLKMSTEIFNKMLNLPIDFFERTPTGEIARDMNERWKIREFLTGELFGTVLDSFVILVILPILMFFSVLLTVIVLGVAVVYCAWLLIMLPVVQRKAGVVFAAEARQSSFLVETLFGIRTIKSLALNARRRYDWDVLAAQTAELKFEEQKTINIVQTVALPIERMMTSGTFAIAVYMVITTQGQVSVGALVVFMMLTMRLSTPLARLAALMSEYDEARFAVRLIAKMVNQPPEEGRGGAGARPRIVGRIEFKDVRFRYPGSTTPALDDISFTIPEGSVFGVMGRSGSGKTTVTRLLQMLHSSYEGLIKVDGYDLRSFDVDHLRSSIGVVLQENFLFRGTVRETIAAARADATFEEVAHAARLAGADEFIERLPRGYDTWIQEGSTNLSGGQRQRLAIARALITNPRILILDEATSALDAESEAIVNANLLKIAKDRTLLVISHRLSSLVGADAILVLERGRVNDIGRHEELLQRCDIYSWLWHQQHRHLQSGNAA